jgi:ActR/RegA family two-component response regulator
MQVYTPPKPAPLPADFDEFFASLSEKERELHELAQERLGSSYFVQWTHMYMKWSKEKAELAKADQKAKK